MRNTKGGFVVGALAIVFGLGFSPALLAQEDSATWRDIGGRGFFMIGYQALDLDDLNSRLVAAGLPQSSGDFLTLGGGGFATVGRLLIGGEGHGLLGSDERTGATETRIAGGHGQFNLGYLVHSTNAVSVYPVLGIGWGEFSLDVVERGDVTFDDVLSDPDRGARTSADGFLLDASVGLEFRPAFGRFYERGEGGFAIALRTGYTFAPGDWDWKLFAEDDVLNGPNIGVEGFYVRLGIGGWGRRETENGDQGTR